MAKDSYEIYEDLSSIIESAQKAAYRSVDQILVLRNWLIGRRIASEKLIGTQEKRYGEKIVDQLAEHLTSQYGKGYDRRSLYRYVQFYQTYPNIVESASPLSLSVGPEGIVASVSPQSSDDIETAKIRGKLLSWTH